MINNSTDLAPFELTKTPIPVVRQIQLFKPNGSKKMADMLERTLDSER